jgi:hypothetical protein
VNRLVYIAEEHSQRGNLWAEAKTEMNQRLRFGPKIGMTVVNVVQDGLLGLYAM